MSCLSVEVGLDKYIDEIESIVFGTNISKIGMKEAHAYTVKPMIMYELEKCCITI